MMTPKQYSELCEKVYRLTTIDEDNIHENRVSTLLYEMLGKKDRQQLGKQAQVALESIEAIEALTSRFGMSNTSKYLASLKKDIPSKTEVAILALAGSKKKKAKVAAKIVAASEKAKLSIDVILDAIDLLGDAILPLWDKDKVDADVGLVVHANSTDRDKFPDEKTLKKGIEKTYKDPEKGSSLLSKFGRFITGNKLSKGDFVEDILGLSFGQLENLQSASAAEGNTMNKLDAVAADTSDTAEDLEDGNLGDDDPDAQDDAAESPTPRGSSVKDIVKSANLIDDESENAALADLVSDSLGNFKETVGGLLGQRVDEFIEELGVEDQVNSDQVAALKTALSDFIKEKLSENNSSVENYKKNLTRRVRSYLISNTSNSSRTVNNMSTDDLMENFVLTFSRRFLFKPNLIKEEKLISSAPMTDDYYWINKMAKTLDRKDQSETSPDYYWFKKMAGVLKDDEY